MRPVIRFGPPAAVSAAFGVIFVLAFLESMSFAKLAQYFPMAVSAAGLALGVCGVLVSLSRTRGTRSKETSAEKDVSIPRVLGYSGWLICYALGTFVLGFLAASVVFVIAFLHINARAGLGTVVAGALGTVGLLTALEYFLDMHGPSGIFGW